MAGDSQETGDISRGCRFLFDNPADASFELALAADMRAARLSPLFRAYYQLRSLIPLPVRQLLQRYRRVETSPRWYFPDSFLKSLVGEIASLKECMTILHPWPDGNDFAFVLTHDVESAEGMRNVLRIADVEQELGFRSSWNIVPHKYPVDQGLLRELTDRGFEIGVHGYNHDGKLFTDRSVFDARVPAINAALKAYGAVGFRAPMVHRNLEWLQAIEVEYDASCFDVDPYQAMPGGVGSIWPFIAGRFVELPYTLPQDHTIFIAFNERDGRIWERKLDFLAAMRGMALIITHPDYLDSDGRIEVYRRFLNQSLDKVGKWHALPRDVARWWRQRDQSVLRYEVEGGWTVIGPASHRTRAVNIQVSQVDCEDRYDATELPGGSDSPAIDWSDTECVSAIS